MILAQVRLSSSIVLKPFRHTPSSKTTSVSIRNVQVARHHCLMLTKCKHQSRFCPQTEAWPLETAGRPLHSIKSHQKVLAQLHHCYQKPIGGVIRPPSGASWFHFVYLGTSGISSNCSRCVFCLLQTDVSYLLTHHQLAIHPFNYITCFKPIQSQVVF